MKITPKSNIAHKRLAQETVPFTVRGKWPVVVLIWCLTGWWIPLGITLALLHNDLHGLWFTLWGLLFCIGVYFVKHKYRITVTQDSITYGSLFYKSCTFKLANIARIKISTSVDSEAERTGAMTRLYLFDSSQNELAAINLNAFSTRDMQKVLRCIRGEAIATEDSAKSAPHGNTIKTLAATIKQLMWTGLWFALLAGLIALLRRFI